MEGRGYIIIYGDNIQVRPYIRDNGFASILRIYGNNKTEFNKAMEGTQKLSLLPANMTYCYSSIEGRDKYYSGLLAYRNAAAHIQDIDALFSGLNCATILKRLLTEDPINWKASTDITSDPLPYGEGWAYSITLNVSSDREAPVLVAYNKQLVEVEAIDLIFG